MKYLTNVLLVALAAGTLPIRLLTKSKRPGKSTAPWLSVDAKVRLLMALIVGAPLVAIGVWFWFYGDANAALRATWPQVEYVNGMVVQTIDGKRFVRTEDGLGGIRLTPLDEKSEK